MRYLELRRHSLRVPPDIHLSPAGKLLAAEVGSRMGPFQRVFSSPLPRALETARAMGFQVEQELDLMGLMPSHAERELNLAHSFAEVAQILQIGGAAAEYGRRAADLMLSLVKRLAEGQAALVVSHLGSIESTAITCLPSADYTNWGRLCSYCEGVRLAFEDNKWVDIELIRVEKST
ncbi:MAG TPA: histidine phosphatase family protein [Chloroflexia bacterium]|nr:histidine phosphatase family protein [Chloroflexia bacterium]